MADVDINRVNQALQKVLDPCSVGRGVPAGLVDMGMVTGVELTTMPDGRAQAVIGLRITSPACTFQPYFEDQVRQSLAAIAELDKVRIQWSGVFDWSDDDMSPALKERLQEKRSRLLKIIERSRGNDASSREAVHAAEVRHNKQSTKAKG
ncbi:iron-sulfur cluster assembly protein [Williamsia sp. 1138]|uniref:metal-sulfur cluster assembly factor n=1 Tax=Williamsia sp. 1138 TaxID=1903117 RepID=UPI001180B0EC|nr:iron-sulfur cluster assembly protein [Williamsia sp. 1138]